MKTLSKRKQELEDLAALPGKLAEELAADINHFLAQQQPPKYAAGAKAGFEDVTVTFKDRTLAIKAHHPEDQNDSPKWFINGQERTHIETLDAVLEFLGFIVAKLTP